MKVNIYGMFYLTRAAMPYELAPTYVYLASKYSSYVTGQVFHVNGGEYLG